jgi:hypothetical protein
MENVIALLPQSPDHHPRALQPRWNPQYLGRTILVPASHWLTRVWLPVTSIAIPANNFKVKLILQLLD